MGCNPTALGGLVIQVRKRNQGTIGDRPEEQYKRELEEYRGQMAALSKGLKSTDTLGRATKVNQKSYNKDGITHGVG